MRTQKKPYSLAECKSFCNDGQIFPAMHHKIDVEGKPKKQAGREVESETDGAVTAGRALQVYRRRSGGTDVPSKPKPMNVRKLYRLIELERRVSGDKPPNLKQPSVPDNWDYDNAVKDMRAKLNELEKLAPQIIDSLIA